MSEQWPGQEITGTAEAWPGEEIKPQRTAMDTSGWSIPGGGEFGDVLNQRPGDEGLGRVLSETASGITEGFSHGASGDTTKSLRTIGVLPPEGQNGTWVQRGNEWAWTPFAETGDAVLRGLNALLGGFQKGAAQTGIEVGQPALGRDIAGFAEAFPTGEFGGTIGIHPPAPRRNALARPDMAGIDRPYLTPDAQADITSSRPNLLLPDANEARTTGVPQFVPDDVPTMRIRPERPPQPTVPLQVGDKMVEIPAKQAEPAPQPGAQPAGAQASTPAESRLTPAEVAAYRATAEGDKLLEPQRKDERDANPYVEGVQPSTAEIEQTVHAARDLKMLNQKVPDVAQEAQQIATDNSEARLRHFDEVAGSRRDIQLAEDRREAQGERDRAAAWANKKAADAQPVVDEADKILRSGSGKQDAVTRNIKAIRDKLYDAAGNLETDPEVLYGVRQEIRNRLSKEAQREEPTNQHAASQLMRLRDVLDGVIEQSAPGFGQYLENFRNASRRIDEMTALQDHRADLFDSANRMQYSRVQRMMKNVVDARMQGGANPYHSITPENMARLWSLRDDLRRSASAQDLARTAGSDSVQNAWHIARDAAKERGPALVGAGIGAALGGGPIGAGIGGVAGQGLSSALSNRTMRADRARGMGMLRPPLPPRNLLGP